MTRTRRAAKRTQTERDAARTVPDTAQVLKAWAMVECWPHSAWRDEMLALTIANSERSAILLIRRDGVDSEASFARPLVLGSPRAHHLATQRHIESAPCSPTRRTQVELARRFFEGGDYVNLTDNGGSGESET